MLQAPPLDAYGVLKYHNILSGYMLQREIVE